MGFKVVTISGINFNGLPRLTKKERKELLERISLGDEDAKEKFINGNLRLVANVIQRYSNSEEEADDLFQVGCIGLVQAVERFDLSYGLEFSTYAVSLINGQIMRYLRDTSIIHVPRSKKVQYYNICAKRRELESELNREVSEKEIGDVLGLSEKEVMSTLMAFTPPRSFDDPIKLKTQSSEKDVSLFDVVPDPKNGADAIFENIALSIALDKLPEKERKVIQLIYFDGLTQVQASDVLHVSQAQVSRIQKKAIELLRESFKEK